MSTYILSIVKSMNFFFERWNTGFLKMRCRFLRYIHIANLVQRKTLFFKLKFLVNTININFQMFITVQFKAVL